MTRAALLSCSLFLLLPSLTSGTGAERRAGSDWPQWRGPHRDAVSREKGLIDGWGPEGPEVVWRIKSGQGFSSITVAHGSLFTLWDEGDRQFLVCLDPASGREIWRRDLGPAFRHPYGDGPRSTPLVEDEIVYAIGTSGGLLAADRDTGETVWQRDLVEDFGAVLPPYGYASSPLVASGRLIIEAGGQGTAFVAMDKATGKIGWSAEDDRPAYSSPIAIEVAGVEQIVFWSGAGLRGVRAGTGEVLWRYPWSTFCPVSGDPLNTATPIFVAPDRLFISSGSGAAMIRLDRVDNAFVVEDVWASEHLRADVNTGLYSEGHLYVFDHGTLKCVDASTGEVRWKARGFGRGSLIAGDGKLIVLGERGNLALAAATPEGYLELSTAGPLTGRSWTTPALAGGRLYLRNQDEVVCVDLRSLRAGAVG